MADKSTEVTPVVPIKGGAPAEVVAMITDPASSDPKNAPPTTTSEQDRKTAGQRHINEKWEWTQQWIAIITTVFTMAACLIMIICGITYGKPELVIPAFLFMCNMDTQVLTSYFTRTNHTKQGGIGGDDKKDSR